MRFKPGQEIVCVSVNWINPTMGPKKGEVIKVIAYDCPYDDVHFSCAEYDFSWWHEKHFEPLMDISELTSILESEPLHERV